MSYPVSRNKSSAERLIYEITYPMHCGICCRGPCTRQGPKSPARNQQCGVKTAIIFWYLDQRPSLQVEKHPAPRNMRGTLTSSNSKSVHTLIFTITLYKLYAVAIPRYLCEGMIPRYSGWWSLAAAPSCIITHRDTSLCTREMLGSLHISR